MRRALTALLLIALLLLSIAALLNQQYPLATPPKAGTQVLASDGSLLRAFPAEDQQWRLSVTPDQVSNTYLELLIGYEDRWFYWHFGVNPASILRAAVQNGLSGRVISGGSTLTMQVARLLHPQDRSIAGKVAQALRAIQLEWHYSKEEILTLYLNLAPFGGVLSGVEAASQHYFSKQAKYLSDAESALLAVLPQRPSYFRPDRYPERAKEARDKLLQRVAVTNQWPVERLTEALNEPLILTRTQHPMVAPLLARRLRADCGDCNRVESLIDSHQQRQLERLVSQYQNRLSERQSVAVMVMRNRDGAVTSYLGSDQFWNPHHGQVDMIQAVRSPGSTLKPFLYGYALDQGLIHSHSLLQDTPRILGQYRPSNFSGAFNGPVSASEALQRSLNIPAVQLIEHTGAAAFASLLQNAGLELHGAAAKNPNPSIILGGVGVKMEQLVGLYSAFANQGQAQLPRFTHQQPQTSRFLLSKEAAWIIWKTLAVPPNQRLQQLSSGGWNLAWKTGTSYGFREAWALGVNPEWSIGVWIGRPDGNPSPGHYGRETAAPLLFQIHRLLTANATHLAQPTKVTRERVCWPTGGLVAQLPVEHCLQAKDAWLINQSAPLTLSAYPEANEQPLIKTEWQDADSGLLGEPSCAAQNTLVKTEIAQWPISLRPWVQADKAAANEGVIPSCQFQLSQNNPLTITSLNNGTRIQSSSGQAISIPLTAMGGEGVRYWYLNGNFIAKGEGNKLMHLIQSAGQYELSVIDQQGNSDRITFFVAPP